MTSKYDSSYWLDQKFDYDQSYGLKKTLLLCSTPRSGSHFLASIIASIDYLGKPFEYFHESHLKVWKKDLEAKSVPNILEYLIRKRTSPFGIFSVKAHWEQLKWFNKKFPVTTKKLNLQNYLFIERKDLLEQAISLEIAFQSKAFISMAEPASVELNYSRRRINKHISQFQEKYNEWEKYFNNINIDPCRINYEDLVKDPGLQLFRICEYMSLDISHDQANEMIRIYNSQASHSPKKQSSEVNLLWKEKYNSGL